MCIKLELGCKLGINWKKSLYCELCEHILSTRSDSILSNTTYECYVNNFLYFTQYNNDLVHYHMELLNWLTSYCQNREWTFDLPMYLCVNSQ